MAVGWYVHRQRGLDDALVLMRRPIKLGGFDQMAKGKDTALATQVV